MIIWSDIENKLVLFIIGAMMFSTVIILLFILYMNKKKVAEIRLREAFINEWNSFIMQIVEGKLQVWPRLNPQQYMDFLMLWNRYQSNLSGDSQDGLNFMAKSLKLEKYALSLLNSKTESEIALGALTLGYLREMIGWDKLKQIAENNTGISGQAAAFSMVRINPAEAVNIVLPIIVRRYEWPQAKVTLIVKEIGEDIITEPLLRAIDNAGPAEIIRLIGLLPYADSSSAAKKVRDILFQSEKEEEKEEIDMIAACLKIIINYIDEQSIVLVKKLLKHPHWVIRVQAINAISDIATYKDLNDLIEMLSDHNWWVRYRSALAIVNMPFIDDKATETILAGLSDKYAIDMLTQVATEKKITQSSC